MGGPSNPPFMDPEDSPFKYPIHVLYLSLIVAIAITIVLAFYHLICTKWFQLGFLTYPPVQRSSGMPEAVSRWMCCRTTNPSFLSSFKYEKDGMESDGECSVCLSVFEQGEELRQLPNCNHIFHAACIDMWLYSHMDCPLCRSPVKFRASQLRLMNSDASV